jgi:tetratricopeptide (TPR) repeat protein
MVERQFAAVKKIVRASEFAREQNFHAALALYRRAALDDPLNASAHYGVGLCCAKLKRWDTATDHLRTAEALYLDQANPEGLRLVRRDLKRLDLEDRAYKTVRFGSERCLGLAPGAGLGAKLWFFGVLLGTLVLLGLLRRL